MLIVISPAKTLDFDNPPVFRKHTQPAFLDRSEALIDTLRGLGPEDLSELMDISADLGELNYRRNLNWSRPFTARNAKAAVLAFRGDVYTGLDADRFDAGDFAFAQRHLRILSGLYGLLRPLDLIQPYRLEMGTALANPAGRNLYEFWGDDITLALNKDLARAGRVLVNLASQEYFKAVRPRLLAAEVITPVFKERKGDGYKIVSFFAKKARGLMSAYIIRRRLEDVEALKAFDLAGYRYDPAQSDAREWVFTREEPA